MLSPSPGGDHTIKGGRELGTRSADTCKPHVPFHHPVSVPAHSKLFVRFHLRKNHALLLGMLVGVRCMLSSKATERHSKI